MRILILSYLFPPFNSIGAVRVGKTAKYLAKFGHDVHVVTANNQPYQPTLQLEIPSQNVTYTRWLNVNGFVEVVSGGRREIASSGFSCRGPLKEMLTNLGLLYKTLLNVPDGKIGWLPFAIGASLRLIRDRRPEIIYASGMPFSSLLLAHLISGRFRVPWVAELRDLWIDNHYYIYPDWRKKLEERLERRVLSSASGLITVSRPLAEILRKKFGKPTEVILNGFDPEDFPCKEKDLIIEDLFRIVYTGSLTGLMYEIKRDPTPLFKALKVLGPQAEKVRIAFYARSVDLEAVQEMSRCHGVEHCVQVHEFVPYKKALRVQVEADALLLLLWDTQKEYGVYTGKLFEYIGARRPILAIGPFKNVAADLIRERNAGVVLNDPVQIADQLRQWIHQKQQTGVIPALPEKVSEGLTREEQTRHLEYFLLHTMNSRKREDSRLPG